jgi:hypothetical protein
MGAATTMADFLNVHLANATDRSPDRAGPQRCPNRAARPAVAPAAAAVEAM